VRVPRRALGDTAPREPLLPAGQMTDQQAGAAIVEFVVLGFLMLVPIALAAVLVTSVHSATYATVTAAREAGRAYVTADSTAQAGARAKAAVQLAMEDQGLGPARMTIECLGGACLEPGSRVRIAVTSRIKIPLIPGNSGQSAGGEIPVTAVHETVVDSYRDSQ